MGIIARQGFKNNIILYVGVFIGFLNILLIQPLVLKPEELGLLKILFSVSSLFASIYSLGFNGFTVKYFPHFRNKEQQHFGYMGFMLLISTLLFIFGAIVFTFFKPLLLAKYSQSTLFIEQFNYVFPMSYFLGIFIALTSYSSILFKSTVPLFLNEVGLRLLSITSVALYYLKLLPFEYVVMVHVFSYLLVALILLFYLKKTDGLSFKIKWDAFKAINWKPSLKFTLIMWITGMASISLRNIDAVFIGSYMGLSDVAVYAIAMTICMLIDVPGNALSKIVLPKVADAFHNHDLKFVKDVYYKSVKFGMLAGSLLFVLIFVNAYDILNLLPKKYIEGEYVVKIIAVGGLFNMVTGLNFNILQYSPYYMFGTVLLVVLAIISALSDVLLIPHYGLVGAAVGTSLSIAIVNLILYFYMQAKFQYKPYTKSDGVIMLITLLLIIIDAYLPKIDNSYLSILVKSTTIGVVFLVVALKTGGLELVNTLIRSRKST